MPPRARRRWFPGRHRAVGVLAAFVAGAGLAVQVRVNGGLATHLHDGIAAALVSNGTALLLVTALLCVRTARAGLRRVAAHLRAGTLRLWECLGGACGALYVASQGISAATLGVAVFAVAVVGGQTGGGLAVDRAGIAPGGHRAVTWPRAASAGLAVVAVGVAVGGRPWTSTSVALAALPLVAGVGLAFQGAVNGRVRQAAAAVVPAVFVNAAVGTAGLVLVYAVVLLLRGPPSGALPAAPWWYLGGVIGLGFIAVSVAVVRRTGVLLLGLSAIAGQLAGGLGLDLVAPGPAGRPDLAAVLGAALTLVAVAVAAAGSRSQGE